MASMGQGYMHENDAKGWRNAARACKRHGDKYLISRDNL